MADANMSPEDFEKRLWFRKDQMHAMAPEGVSTCRSKKKTPKENGWKRKMTLSQPAAA